MSETMRLVRRVTLVTTAILLALAAAAWWSTVDTSRSMSMMVSGLGQVGEREPNDMGALVFWGMWITMMVAMMFPTIAPMVLTHRMVVRRRGEGSHTTGVFVAGYLVVWSAIGVLPMLAFLGFRNLSGDAGGTRWLGSVAGAVLVVAGAYQFTQWKATCLRACRSPMDFIVTHNWGSGARGSLRAGVSHGLFCLGCCWALMSVLVVVGFMNLVWMAVLAVVFLAEKNWKHGVGLTKLMGVGLIGLGIAVASAPSILPNISA